MKPDELGGDMPDVKIEVRANAGNRFYGPF